MSALISAQRLMRWPHALPGPRQRYHPLALDARSPVRRFVTGAAARYLGQQWQEGKPLDPVTLLPPA